jgi:hypothetical protein
MSFRTAKFLLAERFDDMKAHDNRGDVYRRRDAVGPARLRAVAAKGTRRCVSKPDNCSNPFIATVRIKLTRTPLAQLYRQDVRSWPLTSFTALQKCGRYRINCGQTAASYLTGSAAFDPERSRSDPNIDPTCKRGQGVSCYPPRRSPVPKRSVLGSNHLR